MAQQTQKTAPAEYHDDIIYPATLPFVLVHLVCLLALWTGVTAEALWLALTLYLVRMFGVTAGYHRYFSHRSFRTSRVGQFLLAFLAQTSAQRGALWWAAKHRHHHRHSDTVDDVHSPRHHGFWYAHLGWIFSKRNDRVDYSQVPDLAKYPELRWLNRHKYFPAAVLAVAVWFWLGWPGLIVGFFWSTVTLYHGTFFINSLAHEFGSQRYVTGDDSRNNWFLALITLGEGWHNNHHAYQSATRQGFRWWEIDVTYYVLAMLSWIRVVSDLRSPPAVLVRGEQRLGKAVVEKVARQLAASFPLDRISHELHDALARTPSLEEVKARAREAYAHAAEYLAQLERPEIPSLHDIRSRARQMFAHTPSLEDVVARAEELVLEGLALRLHQAQPLPA